METVFYLHGREYWLDQRIIEILNYCFSYGTSREFAIKALKIKGVLDFEVDEVELYQQYLEENEDLAKEGLIKFMKAKMFNLIDSNETRVSDKAKCFEILLALSDSELTNGVNVENLSYEEIQDLLKKV